MDFLPLGGSEIEDTNPTTIQITPSWMKDKHQIDFSVFFFSFSFPTN